MKRIPKLVAVLCAVGAAVWMAAVTFVTRNSSTPPSWTAGAMKLLPAAREYARSLTAKGKPVPEYVGAKDLIAKGLLSRDDLRAFGDMEVTVSTSQDDRRPNQVLVRVRQAGGTDVVLLADGSVQDQRR